MLAAQILLWTLTIPLHLDREREQHFIFPLCFGLFKNLHNHPSKSILQKDKYKSYIINKQRNKLIKLEQYVLSRE